MPCSLPSTDAGFDPVAGILEEESKRREGALPEFDVPEAKQKRKKARTPVSDDEAGSDDGAEDEEDDEEEEEVEPTAVDWDAELDRPVLDPFEDNVSGAAPALVTSSIAVPDGPELDGLMAQGLDLADAAIHANHLGMSWWFICSEALAGSEWLVLWAGTSRLFCIPCY